MCTISGKADFLIVWSDQKILSENVISENVISERAISDHTRSGFLVPDQKILIIFFNSIRSGLTFVFKEKSERA